MTTATKQYRDNDTRQAPLTVEGWRIYADGIYTAAYIARLFGVTRPTVYRALQHCPAGTAT